MGVPRGLNPILTAAVEGSVDEVLIRRLCADLGTTVANVYGKSGKSSVLKNLAGYNNSARHRHWVVLLDLDRDYPCAPDAVAAWLPAPSALMTLRVAVREVEAWLLADTERMAAFLSVQRAEIPVSPDDLADPKRELVNIARRSRSRAIREDIVPDARSGQSVGPAYVSRLIEFITDSDDGWRSAAAAINSQSLQRCIAGINTLLGRPYPAPPE